MHPTPRPDSTDRSRPRRSCRQVFFGTFLPCVCSGWLLLSSGCERPADATRANAGSTTTPAADTETEPVTTAANASPIRLEPPALDFGPIQKGSTAEATVRLINTSDRPVRILQAKTSCGCTVAEVPKELFDPGESIEVTVRFKPKGKIGATPRKTVRFILDGNYGPVSLEVTGTVAEFVVIDAEDIARPITRDEKILLRSTDGRPFRVLGAKPPIVIGDFSAEPRVVHELVVSADLWNQLGSPRDVTFDIEHSDVNSISLRIPTARSANTTTNAQPARSAKDAVSAARPTRPKPTRLQLAPRRVNFGRIAAGSSAVRKLLIRGLTEIDGVQPTVSSDARLARVEVDQWHQTPEGLVLTVRLTPATDTSSRLRSKLTVTYADAKGAVEIYGSTGVKLAASTQRQLRSTQAKILSIKGEER